VQPSYRGKGQPMKTIPSLTNADSLNQSSDSHDISRRSFLVSGAAGGAALLTGGLASVFCAGGLCSEGGFLPIARCTNPYRPGGRKHSEVLVGPQVLCGALG
jgi:hypothetical protein